MIICSVSDYHNKNLQLNLQNSGSETNQGLQQQQQQPIQQSIGQSNIQQYIDNVSIDYITKEISL